MGGTKIDRLIDFFNKLSSETKVSDESNRGELEEQGVPAAGGGGGGKFPLYPTVTKWESGATRGPANQIGLTKWRDIVKVTRGKANPLL